MAESDDARSTKLTHSYFQQSSSVSLQFKTVATSFDQVAAQYPDHVCYIFKAEGKSYTYATLKREIDCVAYALIKLGFEKGDRIGVFLPNSSQNIVFTYVASKIGLTRIHINPSAVARELACTLNKMDCKCIVLTSTDTALNTLRQAVPELDHQSLLESLPTLKHIILIGYNTNTIPNAHSYDDLIKQGGLREIERQTTLDEYQCSVDPNSPLSIFLTSGSMDEPKAAVLTHFGALNIIVCNWCHFGSLCERYCAPLSMSHVSTSIWGALLPSFKRSTVTIPAMITNPEAVMRAIHEEKCSFVMSGPTLLRNILAHPDRHKYNLTSLRYIAVGSTSIQPQFLRELESKLGINRTGQLYGMTETGPLTDTFHCVDNRRHTSVGQCMPFVGIKIVDDEGHIVPINCVGEICARSRFMMRGYYEDDQKTAETISSDGWLRTGDMGTMDEDGYLYFTGRKKEIIIRGGVNIWPIEIEQAIAEHTSVAEVHVFSIPDPIVGELVCAFVKLNPGMACEVDELKIFLGSTLSTYKVPTYIHYVDEFNRTSIGKVSKPKLAEEMIEIVRKEFSEKF